ncbi:toxin Tbo-IT2-like [Bacillus rossius redtenbacheri]|uniref:toxin Tbo-IT2-like n=1 Tax=Bacillus rossius redtenbacheri TaxID=93214 RepID=UPI002FDEDD66
MGPEAFVVLLAALLLCQTACHPSVPGDYTDDSWEKEAGLADQAWLPYSKRGCVRRGGNCDHRPKDCCYNSACRCNLWGSNCRCQRAGLFQQWGK